MTTSRMSDLSDFAEGGEEDAEAQNKDEQDTPSKIEEYLTGRELDYTPERRLRNRYMKYLVEERGFDEDVLYTIHGTTDFNGEWRVPKAASERPSTADDKADFVYFNSPENFADKDHVHAVGEIGTKETFGPTVHKQKRQQVKTYLQNEESAKYGVAVTDDEKPFNITVWIKQVNDSGTIEYKSVEMEPPYPGDELEVPTNFTLSDLKPLGDPDIGYSPRRLTNDIRNYIHTHDESSTNDIEIARQWAWMLLTKVQDEKRGETRADTEIKPKLRIREGDTAKDVAKRVDDVFKKRVVPAYDVFGKNPKPNQFEIQLDDETKKYIVQKLQPYSLTKTDSLLIREAFEGFTSYAVKGDEGQFYTRRVLCEGMSRALSPNEGEKMGDLAAGTGGLIWGLLHEVEDKLKNRYNGNGQSSRVGVDLNKHIRDNVYAVDKAHHVVELMKAELGANFDATPNIHQQNSLKAHQWVENADFPAEVLDEGRESYAKGWFDLLIANFPYGDDVAVTEDSLLRRFDLGRVWDSTEGDDGPKTLTDLYRVGDSTAEDLRDAGINDISDVYETSVEEIAKVDGIGEKTARKIKSSVTEEDVGELKEKKKKKVQEPFVQTTKLQEKQEVSILFLELYYNLLKDGGRMAIVFPETHFTTSDDNYVAYWLRRHFRVRAVWDLPDEMFQPHTHAKMLVLFLEKVEDTENIDPRKEDYPVFMGTVEHVGHNQRGDNLYRDDSNTILKEDITEMAEVTLDFFKKTEDWVCDTSPDRQYFNDIECMEDWRTLADDIESNIDLSGRYITPGQVSIVFNKEITEADDTPIPRVFQKRWFERAKEWAEQHDCELVQLQTLIDEDVVETYRGHGGITSQWFGFDKEVPYIHTSRISGLEVSTDDQHVKKLDLDIYDSKTKSLEIEPWDILLVRRGDFRIGNVGIVYPSQTPLLSVAENEILRINTPNDYNLTPEILLYLLSQDIVTDQLKPMRQYETIIWNVSDRYQQIYLPIPQNEEFREEIINAVQKRAEGFDTLSESLDDKINRIEPEDEESEEEQKKEIVDADD